MTKKITAKRRIVSGGKTKKIKKYPVHFLALVLAFVLLMQGVLFGAASIADWQKGAAVLDVSDGVAETAQEMTVAFQPMIDTFQAVDQFYQVSATQMMLLLDFSDSGVGSGLGFIFNGVTDFYQQASVQLAQLLDVSNSLFWPATVVAVTIQR